MNKIWAIIFIIMARFRWKCSIWAVAPFGPTHAFLSVLPEISCTGPPRLISKGHANALKTTPPCSYGT